MVLIIEYFCNLMSTEMVVVDKPKILTSFDDIINSDKKPIFVKQMTTYQHFKYARQGIIERKFWDTMIATRLPESEVLFNPTGFEDLLSIAVRGGKGDIVFMITRSFIAPIRVTSCIIRPTIGISLETMTWIAVDPQTPSYPQGFIFRQTDMPLVKAAMKRSRRFVETGGVFLALRVMTEEGFLPQGLFSQKPSFENIRDCLSDTLVMDKPGFKALDVKNLISFSVLLAFLIVLSFMTLLIEHCKRTP